MQNQVNEFSLHIIEKILLLLPTTFIVRLQIVSKEWNKLISDPWFINEHRRNSKQNPKFLHITTTATTDVSNKKKSCTFNFTITDEEGRITQKFTKTVDRLGHKPNHIYRVLGYNELVCFRGVNYVLGEAIYLCNPTTQQVLSLPEGSPAILDHSIIGFGYSASSKEYKVARLFFSKEDGYGMRCEIFTLGTDNSWKIIDKKCPHSLNHDTSIFINDRFFWNVDYGCFGISLDTKSYKFSTYAKPELVKEKTTSFIEIDDELGICGYNLKEGIIKVYKVEDYENWIWNEVCKIDLNFNDPRYRHGYWPPRCMVKGELAFFPLQGGRVTFNFETRELFWYKPIEDGGLETPYYETTLLL